MRTASVKRVTTDCVVPPENKEFSAPPPGAGTKAEAHDERKIHLLVFTSLYPNAEQPRHGVFVEERLRHLVESGRISATVVAPVPWFPFRHRRFGGYAAFARVPEREERHGIKILHPRYPVIPKLGMAIAPTLMYHALLPTLQKLRDAGADYDLIDAHYFYPDGVVAARLGIAINKPVVVTARGSDVNLIPHYRLPRQQIQWAAERTAAIVTVSSALKNRLADLGVNPEKMTVLRNGVDLDRFQPRDRATIRVQLGLVGPVWLTVCNLIEPKGVHITLAALAKTAHVTLLIAGEGSEETQLRQLAVRLNIATRVRFLGAIPHAQLCQLYNAADVMVLASRREGMPNVVLESLACGTPVIVTPFESAEEVVSAPEAGRVAKFRTAEAIHAAWQSLLEHPPEIAATRRYAERFGWAPTVKAQEALYARVVGVWRSNARCEALS